MSTLLVVDDEQSICWGLSQLGTSIGHEVVTASSAEQGLELAQESHPDLIVLDVRLPGMDGISAIERFRESVGEVPIIVITAYGDLETAIRAVRNGAFEYILKPFDLETVERAVKRGLARGVAKLNGEQTPEPHVGGIVGNSPALQRVFKDIALAATSEASVLLSGESGTGKELAARAVHQFSDRANGPFVAVNVASLSSTLAESELFGHVRGSFTGAEHDRPGLLVQADGGTLFLDEIADIPMRTQVKLLRALEHGEVTPVGANEPVATNFRTICATHQDLLAKTKRGAFRHDLYFRLAAFRIEIPPLRERSEDIKALAEHFLASGKAGRSPRTLSSAALRELESRPWHGNVRELRNVMEHAMIVARGGVIEPEHLPEPIAASQIMPEAEDTPLDESIAMLVQRWAAGQLESAEDEAQLHAELLRLVEPALFKAALQKHHGQCATAARRLGLHRTTLKKKLDEYGIADES